MKQKEYIFWRAANLIEKENIEAFNSEKPNELLNAFCSIKYQINDEQDSKEHYVPVGVGPFCAFLSDFAWYAGRGAVGDTTYWKDLKQQVRWALTKSRTKNR